MKSKFIAEAKDHGPIAASCFVYSPSRKTVVGKPSSYLQPPLSYANFYIPLAFALAALSLEPCIRIKGEFQKNFVFDAQFTRVFLLRLSSTHQGDVTRLTLNLGKQDDFIIARESPRYSKRQSRPVISCRQIEQYEWL